MAFLAGCRPVADLHSVPLRAEVKCFFLHTVPKIRDERGQRDTTVLACSSDPPLHPHHLISPVTSPIPSPCQGEG